MNKIIQQKRNRSLSKDDRGLSTVEYIIILVLIAVACITLWSEFGDTLEAKITESTGAVSDMQ